MRAVLSLAGRKQARSLTTHSLTTTVTSTVPTSRDAGTW